MHFGADDVCCKHCEISGTVTAVFMREINSACVHRKQQCGCGGACIVVGERPEMRLTLGGRLLIRSIAVEFRLRRRQQRRRSWTDACQARGMLWLGGLLQLHATGKAGQISSVGGRRGRRRRVAQLSWK